MPAVTPVALCAALTAARNTLPTRPFAVAAPDAVTVPDAGAPVWVDGLAEWVAGAGGAVLTAVAGLSGAAAVTVAVTMTVARFTAVAVAADIAERVAGAATTGPLPFPPEVKTAAAPPAINASAATAASAVRRRDPAWARWRAVAGGPDAAAAFLSGLGSGGLGRGGRRAVKLVTALSDF
jgi:hypothetical protein